MTSIQRQFLVLAAIIFLVAAAGAWLNHAYAQRARIAQQHWDLTKTAVEAHLTATFFNEEARVLAHSAEALYDFSPEERVRIEGSIKTYMEKVGDVASSYGKRARTEIENNLQRDLPGPILALMREHLDALALYHTKIDAGIAKPPKTKEEMVSLYAELNDIRARIGDLRRRVSVALADHSATAALRHEDATAKQETLLQISFALIVFLVGLFLLAARLQFRLFSNGVRKAIEDYKADRPVSLPHGLAELSVVTAALEEIQAQGRLLRTAKEDAQVAASEREQRSRRREEAVLRFERDISLINESLADGASAMRISAYELKSVTEEADNHIGSVGLSMETADESAIIVAGACMEMASSISAMSDRLHATLAIVIDTDDLAHEANRRVEQLEVQAARIGEVVTFIQSVAAQTNLLALNATIEAARAGTSGRGFAVVASEVKDLAARSATATHEIADHVRQVQETAASSIAAIRDILQKVTGAKEHAREMSTVLIQQDASVQSVASIAEQSSRHTSEGREGALRIQSQIKTAGQIGVIIGTASTEVDKVSQEVSAALKRFVSQMAA